MHLTKPFVELPVGHLFNSAISASISRYFVVNVVLLDHAQDLVLQRSLNGLLNSLDHHGEICRCTSTSMSSTLLRNCACEELNGLGHLVHLLLDDGFLPCLLDDFGLLHFDCVDDVLNMRVHTSLRRSFRLNDG